MPDQEPHLDQPPPPNDAPKPKRDWLGAIVRATDTVAPLVTRKTPAADQLPSDRRGRVAALLGVTGIVVAVIQLLMQIFDLVSRPLLPLYTALPYIAGLLLVVGIVLAAAAGLRTSEPQQRRRAAIAFSLLTIAAVMWLGWRIFDTLRPPAGFIIAVGEFDGSGAADYANFALRISEHLRSELQDVQPPIIVERTLETYSDASAAHSAGEERKAGMVIWGWYDDLGVNSHVEVLRLPTLVKSTMQLDVPFSAANALAQLKQPGTQQPALSRANQLAAIPIAMPDIKLFASEGPDQLTYITAAIIGMGHAANGEPEKARLMFDKALSYADNAQASRGQASQGQEIVRYQRALISLQENRPTDARADLEAALALNPQFAEAHSLLALVFSEACTPARQLDAALREAQAAAAQRPDDPQVLSLLASIHLRLGDNAAALAEAQRASQLAPDSPELLALLGQAYSATGADDDALVAQQQALRLRQEMSDQQEPETVDTLIPLGDAYMAVSDYTNAQAIYQRAEALAADDPRGVRGLGNVAFWQGRSQDAIAAYEQWARMAPQDPTPPLLLGTIYQQQGETRQALAQLEHAVQLSTCDSAPHMLLGGLMMWQEDYAAAAASYQQALAIDPDSSAALLALGTVLYLQNKLDEAKPLLEKAVAKQPTNADVHYMLGDVLRTSGEMARAQQEWQQTLELLDSDAAPNLTRAYTLQHLERWPEAAEEYQRLLAVQQSSDLHSFLASVYEAMGETAAARRAYEAALKLSPDDALAALGLANAAMAGGDPATAAQAYEIYLRTTPSAVIHTMASLAYTALRDEERMLQHMQSAAELEPDNAFHQVRVAQLQIQIGRLADADKTLDQAAALDPDLPELHKTRGALAYKQCKADEAVAALEQAAALTASDNDIELGLLAGYLTSAGDTERAEQIAETLRNKPLDAVLAHLMAGSVLLALGDQAGAESELARATAAPNSPAAFMSLGLVALGDVYANSDRLTAATDAYQDALKTYPAHAGAQAGIGNIALLNGDVGAALDAYVAAEALLGMYAQSFAIDSANLLEAALHINKALAYRRSSAPVLAQNELTAAQTMIDGWLQDAPQWPTGRLLRAMLHSMNGQHDAAEADYSAAIACDATLATTRRIFEQFLEDLLQ